MTRRSPVCTFFILVLLAVASRAVSASSETSDAGNVYISGADLKIATPVAADLLAAGGRISVEREVAGDAAIAGGTVDVRAPTKQDLRVAAGTVNINSEVGGELVATGATIRLESASTIAGSSWIAGSDVTVGGKLGKGLKVYGKNITVAAEVGGDTRLVGQDISLAPGSKINGNLIYASPNPLKRDPGAEVLGTITREAMKPSESNVAGPRPAVFWVPVVLVLSMAVAGLLLLLLFPGGVDGAVHSIRQAPVRCLLLGIALLFAVPPVAIVLMATVIGIPIGLALLAFYPVMLLLGFLATAWFIGRRIAEAMRQPQQISVGKHSLFLLMALVILMLASSIPFLGGMILLGVLTLGMGAWLDWMYSHRSDRNLSDRGGERGAVEPGRTV